MLSKKLIAVALTASSVIGVGVAVAPVNAHALSTSVTVSGDTCTLSYTLEDSDNINLYDVDVAAVNALSRGDSANYPTLDDASKLLFNGKTLEELKKFYEQEKDETKNSSHTTTWSVAEIKAKWSNSSNNTSGEDELKDYQSKAASAGVSPIALETGVSMSTFGVSSNNNVNRSDVMLSMVKGMTDDEARLIAKNGLNIINGFLGSHFACLFAAGEKDLANKLIETYSKYGLEWDSAKNVFVDTKSVAAANGTVSGSSGSSVKRFFTSS